MKPLEQLPAKWTFRRFRDIAQFRKELFQVDPTKTYQELSLKLYGQGLEVRRQVPGSALVADEMQRLKEGQFVTSIHQFRNGAIGIVPQNLAGSVLSKNFLIYDLDVCVVEPTYLSRFLTAPSSVSFFQANSTGSATPIFPKAMIEEVEIPLPPLAEQRRIMARLAELAAKIEEARSFRQQAIEEAEALVGKSQEAVFTAAEKQLETPKRALDEVARFRTGYAFKSADYRPEGRLIFRVSNIRQDGGINLANTVFLSPDLEATYTNYQLQQDDILMVMVGGSVGKLCLIPQTVLPALMNQNMWRINPVDNEQLLTRYLLHFLYRCNRRLGVGLTQSTHGHLTQGNYKQQLIPLPPLTEQHRIVAYLDDLQAKVDALKKLQTKTAAELDALLPSILDKAFKGEL